MKYPREEQETIITKEALENEWHIYTSDATMMTKKLSEEHKAKLAQTGFSKK